jgi:hypothetical protein
MKNLTLLIICLSLAILIMPTRPAQAYLDPGAGSYLIQVLIGSALAGFYLLMSFWRKIVTFVQNLFGKKKDKN